MRKRSLKYSPCHRVKSHIFEVKDAKNSRVDIFCDRRSRDFFPASLFFSENNAKTYVIECWTGRVKQTSFCRRGCWKTGGHQTITYSINLEIEGLLPASWCHCPPPILVAEGDRKKTSMLISAGARFLKYRFKPKGFALFWVIYHLVDLLSIVSATVLCVLLTQDDWYIWAI